MGFLSGLIKLKGWTNGEKEKKTKNKRKKRKTKTETSSRDDHMRILLILKPEDYIAPESQGPVSTIYLPGVNIATLLFYLLHFWVPAHLSLWADTRGIDFRHRERARRRTGASNIGALRWGRWPSTFNISTVFRPPRWFLR